MASTPTASGMPAIRSLYRQLLRITYRWPEDKLRPGIQFSMALRHEARTRFREYASGNAPQRTVGEITECISALEGLLSSQHKQKYVLPERMLHPAGNPGYYTKLIQELERVQTKIVAPPSLWQRLTGR